MGLSFLTGFVTSTQSVASDSRNSPLMSSFTVGCTMNISRLISDCVTVIEISAILFASLL